jgi:serine/threonine protein kinase
MSNPVDPLHSTAAYDSHASAPSPRDETAPVDAPAPRFGPPAVAGEVGTLGPYRVLKKLGKGGMGAVYLALDSRLERQLALKVMLPEFAADLDAKGRFLREARAAAKITHDNVVIVHEADERDGVPYIAMQFLQGYPLDQYLKTKGPPPLPHVIRIGRETALGLAAAHALGMVHRDIKPANLWLEAPNGRVKVLDFGLAKPVGCESELTRSGTMVGTPAYMSPEQARGLKVDHRTDLYSLGAVLYRLCTGTTPFAGEHVMAVLAAVLTDEPTPVRELNPGVPESLARLIHQLLAKKPEQRPQTADEVAKLLNGIRDQQPAAGAPAVTKNPPAGADASTSLPVVQSAPVLPTAPIQVIASPDGVSAEPGADDDGDAEGTHAQTAPAAPRPERKKGRKGVIAAGVAVLAVLAGVAVASQLGGKNEPSANAPDASPPGGEKEKPEPAEPNGPTGSLPATFKNGIGMEFVKVPKGTGWLGGGEGKPGERKVTFDQDFYLGKYEVTQEEWEKVTGLTPSMFKRGNMMVKDVSDAELKRFPVERVSWEDCQTFIGQLNTREKESGWVYRLPKADEWEYACRGGPVDRADSAFDFYFARPTSTLLPEQANCNNVLKRTCQVGSYEPNSLGLHDMHGNVWEWCDNAEGGADGPSNRSYRGGSWYNGATGCRSANRIAPLAPFPPNRVGLRLARVPSVPGK